MELSKEAMKCAVEIEMAVAMSTSTQAKGATILRYLRAAFDAGARGDVVVPGPYDAPLAALTSAQD